MLHSDISEKANLVYSVSRVELDQCILLPRDFCDVENLAGFDWLVGVGEGERRNAQ